jgi:hypothetical protein
MITFGPPMIQYFSKFKEESSEYQYNKLKTKILKIGNKFKKNTDSIWNYYDLHNSNGLYAFWTLGKISELYVTIDTSAPYDVSRNLRINAVVYPFKSENWSGLINARNAIIHRGKVETTLKNALFSLASLSILLRENQLISYNSEFGGPGTFNSVIFGIKSPVKTEYLGIMYPKNPFHL